MKKEKPFKALLIRPCKNYVLTFLLLVLIQIAAHASSINALQDKKITLSMKNSTLIQLFKAIQEQSGLDFFYKNEQIPSSLKVNLDCKGESIDNVLKYILKGSGLTYRIVGKDIVISPIVVSTGPSKDKVIVGKVVNEKEETLPGVSITIKGTDVGATTDINGNFKLPFSSQSQVLLFSFIGMTPQEVEIGTNTYLTVTLKSSSIAIDEVVVVGFGTQKKVNLTGSVASLSAGDIKDRAKTNVLSSIQGLVPGVTIISRPGQDPTINFRGRGNLGTSAPLYVVDGAITDAAFFANLDPNSIENISFLKDAASSAIYGSRAAYGVVLVTTKKGKDGHAEISYSGLVGTKMVTYKPQLVNSWEYAVLLNEAKFNTNPLAGKNQAFTEEEIGWFKNGSKPDLYPNTNWVDLIYDNQAVTTQHSLNFSDGSKRLRYFAGLDYVYDTENIRNRSNNRYNLNLNVASDLTDWLTFRSSIKYINGKRQVNGGTPSLNNVLITPVTFVAKHTDGQWGSVNAGHEEFQFAGGNPLRAYDTRDWSRSKTENTMYELAFDLKPLKGLIITGQGVYKSTEYKGKSYNSTKDYIYSYLNPSQKVTGSGTDRNAMFMNWNSDAWLNYTGTANYSWSNDVHDFNALLGISYEDYKSESLGASRENFPADTFTDMSAGSTSGLNYANSSWSSEYKMFSYFSRLNYSFKGRYLFEANIRADASSRFHKDHRWGYFPSFSAGWRISEEEFMAKTKNWLQNLKLRVSYGTLGNINNVGNYDYLANYSSSGYYSFDEVLAKVLRESKPANPNLSWEKVTLTNFALDFDLFGNKLMGTVEYYIKNTSDILLAYNVPIETGISNVPSQNIAKVRNKGIELSLTHQNRIGDFTYMIGGNLSTNINRIVNLSVSNDIISNMPHGVGKYILKEGASIGSFYGFKTDGLYTQEDIDAGRYYTYGGITPNAGDVKFVPQSSLKYGEAITNKDRTIIGHDVPKLTYGLNLSLGYKNFEISALGQGVYGTDVAFEVYQMHPFFHGLDNPRMFHLKRWNEANQDPHAIYPRLYDASSPHTAYNRAFSDYNLFDADYFRIKTITLGYTFPKSIVSKLGISMLKMYVTGENLFTFRADKKMMDFDPETAGSVVQALGTKSLAFGVNVSF